MASENQDTQVTLGDKVVGKIDLPKLDVTPFIGTIAHIASAKEYKGQFGYYVKIVCEPVHVLDNGSEICPSRIISLQEDADGNIGWGDGTRMDEFLKKHKVDHYKDLVGKQVIVQTTTKNGQDFLTF